MKPIVASILRTILYADIFDFPMTLEELHYFLIHDAPVSRETVEETLEESSELRELLVWQSGYVMRAGREELVAIREAREAASERLWPQAVRYGMWLACLPFVRMVAVTGALAVCNAADGDDDLDYLIVTQPGRVWLARAFAILLVKLAARRGVIVCPNYVLAADALYQERRDLFAAHEVAQMAPIYGHQLYEQMRQANPWATHFLPNATETFRSENGLQPGLLATLGKRLAELLLSGPPGSWLERWEYRRKLQRFAPDMQKPDSGAQLDETQVKGHFDDYGHPTLRRYQELLQQYGLEEAPARLQGD